jgi:hypothetical protein
VSRSRHYRQRPGRTPRPVPTEDLVAAEYEFHDLYDGVRLNYLAQWVHELDAKERHHRGRNKRRRRERLRIRHKAMRARSSAGSFGDAAALFEDACRRMAEAVRRISELLK